MEKTNLPMARPSLLDIIYLLISTIGYHLRQIPYRTQVRILKYSTLCIIAYIFLFKETTVELAVGGNQNSSQQSVSKAVKTSSGLFMNPEKLFGSTVSKDKTSKRTIACNKYINRFKKVAQAEMDKFGIPASITLAQGLLESNMGNSKLAVNNNNHFGIKCFSKACKKGHCSNFKDDHHKDFFRKFKTAWESYRSHSTLLSGKRYKHLKKLDRKDYKGWAVGLQKAGYATDKRYAKKLIRLIETLDLGQYDR